MEMNLQSVTNFLTEKLAVYKKVVLFPHELPDCDALGSTYALQQAILLNFPEIDVRIAGLTEDVLKRVPKFFRVAQKSVDAEFCHEALGIICDTANTARVLSQLHKECQETLRIDHHIKIETIADYEWVEDARSSTCEMVSLILKTNGWKVNESLLQALYFGLITDTNRFLYDHTTKITFEVMAWMMTYDFDREAIHNQLYLRTFDEAKLDNELFTYVKAHEEGYATLYIDKPMIEERYQDINLSGKIYLMANFIEVKIWLYIYYSEDLNIYKCSIRSREYPVNLIANKFGGGGHRLASGFKLDKLEDSQLVEAEIQKMLKGE
ncbi:DHH family phosphoesterase [Ureaplasma ceti]|uniref:Bifunctional oligoribonuclease/PAP phosphatase NrnA n=1 Tax=Ureaplasma ceti TaxID=3119530 RepID=A0ABP9U6J9_9BACT